MEIIWLIGFYLYTIVGYFYFSHKPTDVHFMTPWENFVPIIPILIVPYLLATLSFLILPIVFYIKLGWEKTKTYLVTQAIASTISYVIFGLFPTSVVREPLIGNGIFWDVLRWLHTNDRPSAAFPSGHVFGSIIVSYFLWIWYPKTRPFIIVILPMIIIATVTLRQHYLPDIPGGMFVAIVAVFLGKLITPKLP